MPHFREVVLPDGVQGRMYLHGMPGRYENLEEAWAEIRSRRIGRIVCLASLDEVREKSPDYATALEADTVPCCVRRFPIPDFDAPHDDGGFSSLATEVAASLRDGERVLVHCGAGVGRTGMLAIAVLMALSLPLDQATRQVKAAGSAAETEAQREALKRLEKRHNA